MGRKKKIESTENKTIKLENNKKTANAKFEASQKEINSSKTKIQNAKSELAKNKKEFEKSKNLPYEEDAFTYFIDATTCEIVGGE